MKISTTKIWIAAALVAITGICVFIARLNQETDLCPDRKSGRTIISGKVVDSTTNKLIDSIHVKIYAGMLDGDLFLDTLLIQKDSFSLAFTISETYECETFWYFVSNENYKDEFNLSHYEFDSTGYIPKGGAASAVHFLKPLQVE